MLTETQIESYENDGYLVLEGLITGERLAAHRAVLDALVERARSITTNDEHFSLEIAPDGKLIPGFLHKVQGVCAVERKVLDLATEPDVLAAVTSLLGPDLDIFGTKFFPKLPHGGTSTAWHQDTYYFGTDSPDILSCGIYLDDTDRDNGCLRVVPGSHRTGRIATHAAHTNSYGAWVDVADEDGIDVAVPGGTVVLFSANLMHGAHDNISDRCRYSTAWHYVPATLEWGDFTRAYHDRHIVQAGDQP